jgi:adenosylcobinamide-phosphate synthase
MREDSAGMPLLQSWSAEFPFHPLLLLLAALALEPFVGEAFAKLPHPVRLIGGIVGLLDRKLNREDRSEADRRGRGILLVLFVCLLAATAGAAVTSLSRHVPFGWLPELALMISLLAQRSLFRHVRRVGEALRDRGLEAGRAEVAHIVGRDVRELDDHGVARAAIESCAENFSDAVVAPAFWYVLFGLPGMLVYKAINTMDSMIGYRSKRYLAFGWAAARLDDAVNLVPARLAALYLAVAALAVPDANPARGLRTMIEDAGKHRSPNAGWPEAAMAGALGLSLAGPRRYPGVVMNDAWIGNGTALATARDVMRALSLFTAACVINGFAVAAIALARMA